MASAPETPEPRRPLTAQAFAATFNHLLQQQSFAQKRLQRHAGKTLQLNLPPLSFLLTVEASGQVVAAAEGSIADATLGVSPLSMLHVLAGSAMPSELVHTAGDSTMAVDFGNILQNLRWDAEEDLSKVFGDVLGHRIASFGAGLFAQQKQAALNLAANLTEYWTEERPLLAKRQQIASFVQQVDQLRDDAERLEKRVARLQQRSDS
jgi:ubiquinone biosynthesis protein UbiJ